VTCLTILPAFYFQKFSFAYKLALLTKGMRFIG
jgi:hypothetical protein